MAPIKIFICYAHEDVTEAEIFRRILTNCYGLTVFMADFSLVQSKDWYKDIVDHLEINEIFIPVVSKNLLSSAFANQEIGYAYKNGSIILPLRIEPTKPPGMLDHTEGLKNCSSRGEAAILNAANELSLLLLTHSAFSEFSSRAIESLVIAIENNHNFLSTSGIVYMLELTGKLIKFNDSQIKRITGAVISNPYFNLSTKYYPRLKSYLNKYYSVVL